MTDFILENLFLHFSTYACCWSYVYRVQNGAAIIAQGFDSYSCILHSFISYIFLISLISYQQLVSCYQIV